MSQFVNENKLPNVEIQRVDIDGLRSKELSEKYELK